MSTSDTHRSVVLQIGRFRFTGLAAGVISAGVVAIIIAVIARVEPAWQNLTAGIVWFCFSVYWAQMAVKSAATKSSESKASRAVHTRLMTLAFFLLFVPVPGLGIRFLPATLAVAITGLAVVALSFLLAISARRHLGRNWSAAITVAENHQLIQTGPYSLVRHPIYSAVLGMFYGTAIASGTVHALGGAVVMTLAYARKIRLEERNLRNVFGPAYDEYRKSTWALIPGLM